ERLVSENGKLYIAQRGDYGYGNTISVMDLNSQTITSTIDVADYPNGMVEDGGFLFVLCSGKPSWTGAETSAAMYKINLENNEIVDQFTFETGVHPTFLQIEESKV